MKTKITEGFELIQDIIRPRWIPEIIATIALGNHSYSKILDSIEYISKTELNRKLNLLIEKKVILKNIDQNRSEYRLLEFGEDIDHIFKHFYEVGEKYIS